MAFRAPKLVEQGLESQLGSNPSPWQMAMAAMGVLPIPGAIEEEGELTMAKLLDMAKSKEAPKVSDAAAQIREFMAKRGSAPQAEVPAAAPQTMQSAAPELVKKAPRAAKAQVGAKGETEYPWLDSVTAQMKPTEIDYEELKKATAPYEGQTQDALKQILALSKSEPKEKQIELLNNLSKIMTKDPKHFAAHGDMMKAGAQRLAHMQQLLEILSQMKARHGVK